MRILGWKDFATFDKYGVIFRSLCFLFILYRSENSVKVIRSRSLVKNVIYCWVQDLSKLSQRPFC